ncbi:radical SAM protein [Acidaminococcus timonensis]|uniref:radical SAM/SPASM domain-containing protein n=1 Tax=Acidaminococcus timonensis TaxID=1871002 RepID=UPI0026E95C20|nr:radical SAM protein [Acidaminococcus timonensis]
MNFIVKVTTQCNFHCDYCSEGNQEPQFLSLELFKKLVDEIPEIIKANKEVEILWHGGEPLLWGLKRLDAAMNYAEKKLNGFHYHFSMQSNGYLIDDAAIEILKRHHVRVGVSLDGYPENHDKVRRTKDGKGTWDMVWNNVQRLKRENLSGGILMVYRGEEDVQKVFDFLSETEIPCKINPLLPFGRAAELEDQSHQVYESYVDFLEKLYTLSAKSEKSLIIEPLEKIMDALLQGDGIRECSYSGMCGKDILCLYADGNIGFCGRDSETKDFIYGNLREQSLSDLYKAGLAEGLRERNQYLQEHGCSSCDVFQYCHGGCPYEALHATGSLLQKFPYCSSRKRLLHFLKSEGILLLKQRLLRDKRKIRKQLSIRRKLQEELSHARE